MTGSLERCDKQGRDWPEVEEEVGEGVPVGLGQVRHGLQQGRLAVRLVRVARRLHHNQNTIPGCGSGSGWIRIFLALLGPDPDRTAFKLVAI